MLKGIENIVFDLGGVIINLNHDLTWSAFQNYFPNQYIEIIERVNKTKFLEQFETGNISEEEFVQFFNSYKEISSQQILTLWNNMLLDIPYQRIMLIEELRKNYRLFLLSNTNSIHYQFIDKYYQSNFNKLPFDSLFEKAYLSYKVGLRKPDIKIFEHVLNTSNLRPNKTLFIDDSIEHINAAKSAGIKAIHLDTNKKTLIDLFK